MWGRSQAAPNPINPNNPNHRMLISSLQNKLLLLHNTHSTHSPTMQDPQQNVRVWYQLVDASTGHAFPNSSVDSVFLQDWAIISDFRKAVKTENADSYLQGISPTDLKVFKNMADLDEQRFIDEDILVTNIVGQQKMAKEDALLVMVPQGT